MNILSAEGLSKSYGEKTLLRDVTFGIEDTDRIGLIGVNGAGKSTLLKIAAGLDWPDSGKLSLGSKVRVHYLPQEPEFAPGGTVINQVFEGDLPVMKQLREYHETLQLLAMDEK